MNIRITHNVSNSNLSYSNLIPSLFTCKPGNLLNIFLPLFFLTDTDLCQIFIIRASAGQAGRLFGPGSRIVAAAGRQSDNMDYCEPLD